MDDLGIFALERMLFLHKARVEEKERADWVFTALTDAIICPHSGCCCPHQQSRPAGDQRSTPSIEAALSPQRLNMRMTPDEVRSDSKSTTWKLHEHPKPLLAKWHSLDFLCPCSSDQWKHHKSSSSTPTIDFQLPDRRTCNSDNNGF